MADRVEEILNEMVPELDDLKRKKIFDDPEVRHIIRRRREFEYLLQKPSAKPQDYLSCIRYEVALENLRARRSKALNWKRKTISDVAGIRRMHFVFDRSVKRFKGDMRLWYQYIDFCLRSGSTQILTRVLLRCLKLHPREVNLWLLAADRSLKMGQIKAARTLLLRGLRFMPRSAKLWAEFLRLEIQVARNMQLGGRSEPAKETKASPWAPASLLLRKACSRLRSHPQSCASFLAAAQRALESVRSDCGAATTGAEPNDSSGFEQLAADLRATIAELRPSDEACRAEEVAPEAVRELWQLWWEQERACGKNWQEVGHAVIKEAPPPAVHHFAARCAEEGSDDAGQALLEMATSPRCSADGPTALAVLEALECWVEDPRRLMDRSSAKASVGKADAAALALLRRAVESDPACVRLRLVACQRLPPGEKPLSASDVATLRGAGPAQSASKQGSAGLEAACAAQFMVATQDSLANSDASASRQLETLFRALAPGESPRPLLEVYVAEALVRGGVPEFKAACSRAVAVAKCHWESPRLRTAVLTALLEIELGASVGADVAPRLMCDRFEDVLASLDDKDDIKIDWWVRYVDFVQRVSHSSGKDRMPNVMDLHWRAMRSVANQALYSERVHNFLQAAPGSAS